MARWGSLSLSAPPLTHSHDTGARARSHCRFVLPFIHFIPDERTCFSTSISEAIMRPDPAQELVRLLATACSPPATVDDVLRRVFAQPQPSPPKRPGQRRLAELQGDNSQGWPKLWANFNTLIGVSSHTAGPTLKFWAGPANFRFRLRRRSVESDVPASGCGAQCGAPRVRAGGAGGPGRGARPGRAASARAETKPGEEVRQGRACRGRLIVCH